MHDLAIQLNQMVASLLKNLSFIGIFIAIFWGIHFLNAILGHRLSILGVYPRKWYSLLGIFCYPFLHANFNHLFFNSIPLGILASLVLLYGTSVFYSVTLIVIVLSGIGIWLFARPGIHIGASGLVMGYWSFLLISAYYQGNTVASLASLIVCVYYFGGLLFHLFPTEVKTSFEAHIFGFLAGIAAFYIIPLIYIG